MADSEFRPTSLVSASTSILSPLSDALINIDHAVDNDISPADFFSQNRDELCPCIFHIYFKTCENVDCRFSHSSKAIASRPASPSSDLRKKEKPTSQPQGELSQSRKYLVKGHYKQGDRLNHSHQRPETKTNLPRRGKTGHSGDSVAPTPSPKSPKKSTLESSATSASPVVQEVEVNVAQNEGSFGGLEDDQNDNHLHTEDNFNQLRSPRFEHDSYQSTPTPEAPSSYYNINGHDASKISLHDDPISSHTDGPDGADSGDDYNSESGSDDPAASKDFAIRVSDDEDKWGWNEDPREKEAKPIISNLYEWTTRRDKVDIEVEEPVFKENMVIENGSKIDLTWSQVPDDQVEDVQSGSTDDIFVGENRQDNPEELRPAVDEVHGTQDLGQQELDRGHCNIQAIASEELSAARERQGLEQSSDEPLAGLDTGDRPHDLYWQRSAPEFAEEFNAGDEPLASQPLSFQSAEESTSGPHNDQRLVFDPEDAPIPAGMNGDVGVQHQISAPHSRFSIQTRSSAGSIQFHGTVLPDTPARSVPVATYTPLPTILTSLPPTPVLVPVSVPPSMPALTQIADARQISMMSLHWCRFADGTTDPTVAFCKAFAQNKCSNATSDTCTFRHCLTPQEYTLLFKDPQPLQFSLPKSLIRNDSPEDTTLIKSPSFTLHWSHFADPTCDSQVAFCKLYAEHTCLRDISCNYRHCLTLEEYTLLFKDPQPNLIAVGGAAGDPSIMVPQPRFNFQQRGPCIYFQKGRGGCKNGVNCPFLHECPNIHATSSCNDANCSFCSSTLGAIDQVRPRASRKLCIFWSKGTCKNEDKCPFSHIGDPGAVAISGGVEITSGGTLDDTVKHIQRSGWEASDSNGRDNGNAGNWGDVNHEQEVNNDHNDQNHFTDWDDQKITAQDQNKQVDVCISQDDQQKNDHSSENRKDDTDSLGNQNIDTCGWEDQNNDAGGWGNQTLDASGWGNQNNDASGWGNKSDDKNGLGSHSNNYDRRRHSNRWNNAQNGSTPNNCDDWRNTGTKRDNTCYKFRQTGRCWRGQDCRFSHDLEQGGSSGHELNDVSILRQSKRTLHTPIANSTVSVPCAPSTYGGRGHYDRGFIDEWKREVTTSEIASEASDSQAMERHKGTGSRSGSRGRAIEKNRLVEHLPTDDTCQFYLTGRCTIGDNCPSFHDAVASDISGSEYLALANGRKVLVDENRRWGRGKGSGRGTHKDSLTDKVENRAEYDNDHVVNSDRGHGDQDDASFMRGPEEEIQVNVSQRQIFCKTGESHLHVGCEQPSPERSVKNQQLVNGEDEEQDDVSEPGTWSHASDIDSQTGVKERDYGHPLVERPIFNCAVTFGRSCLPDEIMTGTDSRALILEGPPGISEARVHDYAHRYGPIKDIVVTPDVPMIVEGSEDNDQEDEENRLRKSAVRIEFKDMKDAAAAARSLKDHGATLAGAIPIEPANMKSTWVRFKWPQVTRAAWIHYSSIAEAKTMAEKLHGSFFRGKKITASSLRPDKRQKDLFAIKLERLPADTTREDLVDISQNSRLITMSELTYTARPREVFQQSAGVKFFVNIPEDPTKLSAVAFACLDSEDSILRAIQMHGTKLKLIGKQELTVERVWFVQYSLLTDVFKSVSTEVAALQIRYEGRVQVESRDFGDHYMVYLHAHHEETETFVQANLSLQAICHGLIVVALDDQPEWDDYLYSTSSIKVIENLNTKNSFYIFPNLSTRQIHIFGCGIEQDKGVSTIKKLLQRVRGSCREYPIHRNVIRQLIDGGLTEIQAAVGANKLSLDVIRSVLIVRGENSVLMQKIHHLLDFLPSKENLKRSRQLCSICKLKSGGSERNPTVKLLCGHVYCGACLKNALIYAAQNHFAPVKCISPGPAYDLERGSICGQPIAYTTARDLLPLLMEPDYLKVAFLSFIHSSLDEYFFCPSLQCNTVYRRRESETIICCPICRAWLCLFCGSMSHDGITCEKAKEMRVNIPRRC